MDDYEKEEIRNRLIDWGLGAILMVLAIWYFGW